MHYEDLFVGAKVVVDGNADFMPDMMEYRNTVVTISELISANDIRVEEDSGEFRWYASDFAEMYEAMEWPDVDVIVGSFASLLPSEV